MIGDYVNLCRDIKKCLYSGQVKRGASLKDYSSFKIGGRCRCVVTLTSIEEILKVTTLLETKHIPYIILGNGTNILFPTGGYDGVVLKISPTFSYIERKGNSLIVDGGTNFNSLLQFATSLGLSGLEEGAGIPGSVGGMVVMNAGAFGFSMSSVVTSVLALVDGKIRHFTNDECGFGYRKSVFQSLKNSIILRVEFGLKRGKKTDIRKTIASTLSSRAQKQPLEYPNCGSVFRRVDGLNVGKLLDDEGYKGLKIGGAMVSTKHANFIVNTGGATSNDVKAIIEKIQKEIYQKYKIQLVCEIKIIE